MMLQTHGAYKIEENQENHKIIFLLRGLKQKSKAHSNVAVTQKAAELALGHPEQEGTARTQVSYRWRTNIPTFK